MKIQTVEYRKLVTHGQYNNTTIGAVGEVETSETPHQALTKLQYFVDDQLAQRVKATDGLYDEQEKLHRVEQALRERKRDLEEAERRFEQAQAVLSANGISLEKPKGIWDDMPF